MVEETGLAARVSANLARASQFAKFLVAPYTLNLSMLNYYMQATCNKVVEDNKYLVVDDVFQLVLHVPVVYYPYFCF